MKITGLLGYPLGHSFSPELFNRCYRKLELDYHYYPFAVPPQDLRAAVLGLKALGARGVNVTIPHKEKILRHLDRLDPLAGEIQAVNAVVFEEGEAIGFNTDAPAFWQALRDEARLPDAQGCSALILGAGGAARAAAYALLQQKVQAVYLFNRTENTAQLLAGYLRERFPNSKIEAYGLEEKLFLEKKLERVNVIINCTSLGMYPQTEESPLAFPELPLGGKLVYDLIYNPVQTQFLAQAKNLGAKTLNGLSMLIHQAALSFQLWTGQEPPLALMKWFIWEKFEKQEG